MRVLEYGKERERTLLFLPCTAEPDWAFTDAVTLLAQEFYVLQVIYDGHGGTGEDFVSVEKTVNEITDWLQGRGITRLDAAYGCSLGGACLTRLLAEGRLPVGRAVSAAAAPAPSGVPARYACRPARDAEPENSGGCLSAGALDAAGARPRAGIPRPVGISPDILEPEHPQHLLVGQ